MSYVKLSTLEKLEAADIMLAHPDISFPNRGWTDEDLAPYGYAELHYPSTHPFPGTFEKLVETTPAQIDGKWYIQFEVVPMTSDEVTIKQVEIKAGIVRETQAHLDNFAQSRNYDGILSLCTYATSPTQKFAEEGQYGVEARDATWAKLYEIMAEVEAGTRPMPTSFADVVSELPVLQWPA